ncbi:MAG UNVERIFIED_CONTAM: hypothetical protein LVR18_05405 [Planctomycetaceae bacterium]|jgi:mono/diheme cytochrome c family protein
MVRLKDVLLCVSAVWLFASTAATAQQPEVNFSRQIKPLLARRCFACHGPDKAESGLRLNSLEAATKALESGHSAIVPGNSDASELLRRIASTEEGERMPPKALRSPKPNRPCSATGSRRRRMERTLGV